MSSKIIDLNKFYFTRFFLNCTGIFRRNCQFNFWLNFLKNQTAFHRCEKLSDRFVYRYKINKRRPATSLRRQPSESPQCLRRPLDCQPRHIPVRRYKRCEKYSS